MAQSARFIFLVLSLVLFGGHFVKGQQEGVSDSGQQGSEDGGRVGRIVAGVPVTSTHQPYAVITNAISQRVFFFAGAVLSNTEIITSASALRSAGNITRLVSAVGSNPSFVNGTIYEYLKYEVHSGFNSTTLENDVAVITVNGTFAGLPNVRPITLATTEIPVSPSNRPTCVVVGWGQFANGNYHVNVSQTNYELLTDQECGGAIPPS
ncbi:trypsin delta-like [Anopheles albimanus]|nr:trypsin delta-like [Anopheles albimanus]